MTIAKTNGAVVVCFPEGTDYDDVLDPVISDCQAERAADRYARRRG